LIHGSLWAFFWTISLLFLLSYVAGALFTQGVTDLRGDTSNSLPHAAEAELVRHFGDVPTSILSMLKAVLGGVDWQDLLDPIKSKIFWSSPVFIAYIGFAGLVMLNLVTGVFVDGAHKLSQRDMKLDLMRKLEKILQVARIPPHGFITRDDFMEQMDNPDMVAFFQAIGVSMEQEHGFLFSLLDTTNRGQITPEAFVLGGLRLQGQAQAFDLAKLVHFTMAGFHDVMDRLDDILRLTQDPRDADVNFGV